MSDPRDVLAAWLAGDQAAMSGEELEALHILIEAGALGGLPVAAWPNVPAERAGLGACGELSDADVYDHRPAPSNLELAAMHIATGSGTTRERLADGARAVRETDPAPATPLAEMIGASLRAGGLLASQARWRVYEVAPEEREEAAREVHASSAADAAERWAQREDATSRGYIATGGTVVTVAVRPMADPSLPPVHYVITGDVVPEYEVRATAPPTATCPVHGAVLDADGVCPSEAYDQLGCTDEVST